MRPPQPGPTGIHHVNPGGGNGGGTFPTAKRGATAAEALAAELHREIAVREKAERRLLESEARLAEAERRLATPAVPPMFLPGRERVSPSDDRVRGELERRLAEAETRLAHAESRAAQAEQRLAYLMTSSPLGFFDADLITGNSYYSFGFKEMLGYRPGELPGHVPDVFGIAPPRGSSHWLAGGTRTRR